MSKRKIRIIKQERKNMTDDKRVSRALEKCAVIFEEERLNMSEGLAVAEQILINTFGNAADSATNVEELQGIIDIAEEYLTTMTNKIANEIKGS